jgi:hypothetical protein
VTCSVCDHGPPSGPAAEISNACAEAHKTLSTWQVRGPCGLGHPHDAGDVRVQNGRHGVRREVVDAVRGAEDAGVVDEDVQFGQLRRRWGEAHIARHRSSTKTATATPVGPITIDCDVLTAPGADLRIVVYTAVPGSSDAAKLELLRVAGTQALTF